MIRENQDRIDELQKRVTRLQQPYTVPSNPWIGGPPSNPWDGVPQPQTPHSWTSSSLGKLTEPAVVPEIRYETIKRYAEAGVPFPLDATNAWPALRRFIDMQISVCALQDRDSSELSVHMTVETAKATLGSQFKTVQEPFAVPLEDDFIGKYRDIPIYAVDDESQQGVFAPLEPFYRFAFV